MGRGGSRRGRPCTAAGLQLQIIIIIIIIRIIIGTYACTYVCAGRRGSRSSPAGAAGAGPRAGACSYIRACVYRASYVRSVFK